MHALGGLRIAVDAGLEALDSARTVIIPGWRSHHEPPPEALLQALRRAHARGARLLSICSGVFALAATGLLDGKTATTHWQFCTELAERFPLIKVDPNVLYVDSGPLITSAGSAAGIDACLHLIARDFGTHVANSVARRLVMAPQRTGGQAQFIVAPVSKSPRNELSRVLQWLREHLDQPLSVCDMAARVAMSERTFLRRFVETTGLPPKTWLQQERLNRARELLESTDRARPASPGLRLSVGGKFPRRVPQRCRFAAHRLSRTIRQRRALPTAGPGLIQQPVQLGVLQQHDGLAVANFPGLDHAQSLVEGQLQHFDLLAFGFQATAFVLLVFVKIFADEKCTRSVTEPGLMKASNTLRTSWMI